MRFERLELIDYSGNKSKDGHRLVLCLCDCGNMIETRLESLTSGCTSSCGCLRNELRIKRANDGVLSNIKHGAAKKTSPYHNLYNVWRSMNYRCLSETCRSYKNYGGRGITVCDHWSNKNPNGFFNFRRWAYDKYRRGLHLDRIKNNNGYGPDNCRFVTNKINQLNKRTSVIITFRRKTMTQVEWATFLKVNYQNIYHWRKHGMIKNKFKQFWP